MYLLKIYANWCPHCINMAKDWDMLKSKLPNYVNVLEIEENEIHKLKEFNKKHKRNVVSNGYPTIAKVVKNKVHYYNGPRIMKNMLAWVIQTPTRKRKTRKNRTKKRKN
jgi:thiol-disulfide isomerase/thioredoxin